MEITIKKPLFKPADELIRLWKESKRQSKIEAEQMFHTAEYQAFLIKLRALKNKSK